MESLRDTGDRYRLIVTRRNASEILLLPEGSGWALPRAAIHRQQRIAEQLTNEVRRAWGLAAYCLFVPNSLARGQDEETKCAILETVRQNDKAPAGTYWMPPRAATGCAEPSEASVIRESLEELDSYSIGKKSGPFANPGWLRELFLWTDEQIAPFGLRLSGGFRQCNASPTFCLMRLETGDGALWFKATGEPNAHELPVTVSLARLFPSYLPRILGVHSAWNGWLSAEVPGSTLDGIADCSAWERAAENLAELQIASLGKTSELLAAQCKDLRIPKVAELADAFLARMAEFMAAQEKPSPAPLSASEIASLREGLAEACALFASFGLPDTLGHMDFNPGNILVSEDHCTFLDWAEGCATNPLITFEYLREHIERSAMADPSAAQRLTEAYIRPWTSFSPANDLRRALAVSPFLAVFVYATAGNAWRSPESIDNPTLAGYFRSLTRRMYREAIRAAQRSELCLD
ncbi:MAG TPA: phosphotransferase [Candidatus Acidoferrales bacterium]|nr:phosphotransferase [Candidatus Acidoferrales bacterium]